jgi:hypothetical protein
MTAANADATTRRREKAIDLRIIGFTIDPRPPNPIRSDLFSDLLADFRFFARVLLANRVNTVADRRLRQCLAALCIHHERTRNWIGESPVSHGQPAAATKVLVAQILNANSRRSFGGGGGLDTRLHGTSVAGRADGRAAPAGHAGNTGFLALTALGVVLGDIGTSPLYAFSVALGATGQAQPTAADVLGIVSLIFLA